MKNYRDVLNEMKEDIEVPKDVWTKYTDTLSSVSKQTIPFKGRPVYKRWMTVAATLTLMLVTTVGVLAANKFFSKETVKSGDTTTYKFDIDNELKPGIFELTPGYLPEGYYEREEGKYWSGDDKNSGISVFMDSTADIERQNYELDSYGELLETMTIGNSEAEILVEDKANPDKGMKNIHIFNALEGYVVWVWGDKETPLADVKRFAEELVVTRVGDDQYETVEEKTERQKREKEGEEAAQEWDQQAKAIREAGISDSDLFTLGTEAFKEEPTDAGNMVKTVGYTVENAEFIDSVVGYDKANFYNYDEVTPWLNEDGSLKPYSRVRDMVGDGHISSSVEGQMVNQSLLKVTVKAKRYHEDNTYLPEDALITPLDGRLIYLEKKADGNYTWDNPFSYRPEEDQDYGLVCEDGPIYMDKPQFTEGDKRAHSFFFRDLAVGEEIEYTLLFVVDEDRKDSLALDFNGFSSMEIEKPTWFKIK